MWKCGPSTASSATARGNLWTRLKPGRPRLGSIFLPNPEPSPIVPRVAAPRGATVMPSDFLASFAPAGVADPPWMKPCAARCPGESQDPPPVLDQLRQHLHQMF